MIHEARINPPSDKVVRKHLVLKVMSGNGSVCCMLCAELAGNYQVEYLPLSVYNVYNQNAWNYLERGAL